MGSDKFVINKETGKQAYLADNESLTDIYCPIDGAQMVKMTEYDFNSYSCKTCDLTCTIRRGGISQEDLNAHARNVLDEHKEKINGLEEQKNKLLKILKLAEKNNFK